MSENRAFGILVTGNSENALQQYKLSLFGFTKSHSAGKQSRKAREHSVARAQLRHCQGSSIDDYSFVLSDVAGTPRMDSLQIANRTFFTQFYLFVKGLLSI